MSPFDPHWERPPPLTDAIIAAALTAIDPALGGIQLRAWSGPSRDAFQHHFTALMTGPIKKMPLGITDDRLLGGLDLAATLSAGSPVQAAGLLTEAAGGTLILAMADRITPSTAARLATALDTASLTILALDESATPDESPPPALLDRLGFTLTTLPDPSDPWPTPSAIAAARARFPHILRGPQILTQIITLAAMLGIRSARAEFFTLRAALASAALRSAPEITDEDLAIAARLVLAPRATQRPSSEPPPDPSPNEEQSDDTREQNTNPLEDRTEDAATATLPPGLLAALAAHTGPRRTPRGAGTSGTTSSLKRGRPITPRRGPLTGHARLALLDTIRAAAPWQRLRSAPRNRIAIRAEDFHIKRFREKPRHITIFAVDASGSSALNRLAEAKGAIQLLLAACYVRRDEVALIAFRNTTAELLLPPTHALARARRALAALPGGGPTPLSHGITAATALAQSERRAGKQPLLVFLTDGGANIAKSGAPGRAAAGQDALAAAKSCAALNLPALVVDTAPRKHPFVTQLAAAMSARYLALPYADPSRLSAAIQSQAASP